MITNDEELTALVAEVSAGLQEIQDYMGARQDAVARVRFPRGYIRTAAHHRKSLWFLRNMDQRNISYSMQSLDILKWVANRTDLAGPAKTLLNRVAIVLLGSVAEALIVKGTASVIGKGVKFKRRLERMHTEFGIINKALRADLEWLWDQRNSIHIDAVTGPHIELFHVRDVNRAFRIVRRLRERLDAWHTE